jgi:hypothetical protein
MFQITDIYPISLQFCIFIKTSAEETQFGRKDGKIKYYLARGGWSGEFTLQIVS